MVTQHTLDSQITVELPAREMLAFFSFNFWQIISGQVNTNGQLGLLNVNTQGANNTVGNGS